MGGGMIWEEGLWGGLGGGGRGGFGCVIRKLTTSYLASQPMFQLSIFAKT